MTEALSRRNALRLGTAGALGISIAGSFEAIAGSTADGAVVEAAGSSAGYGPLIKDPAGLLALPKGFKYTIVAEAGKTKLESGQPTPSDADGTASFPGHRGLTLVNNHENDGTEPYPVPALEGLTYDPAAKGGTTNIDVDYHGKRLREYVSLAGTHNNCAGGKTPWGTWLTCEETEQKAVAPYTLDHGYVFEVDPFDRAANKSPVPLKFLGRYAHEAVAVDPNTHAIYLTEDANEPHGLFYRWTPPHGFHGGKGALKRLAQKEGGATAGKLQAMSCSLDGKHITDLSQAAKPGTKYKVKWVDVADRDAQSVSVRKQFTTDQVTGSRKLEGCWWGHHGAYFVASYARKTDGSVAEHDGQVWFYDPRSSTVTLETIFGVNKTPDVDGPFDGPDNITVSPYGGVILAEDGEGVQHLIGVTDRGASYPIARNDFNGSEFTGPNFSADGSILFANIQTPGYVLAITGPWTRVH